MLLLIIIKCKSSEVSGHFWISSEPYAKNLGTLRRKMSRLAHKLENIGREIAPMHPLHVNRLSLTSYPGYFGYEVGSALGMSEYI